MSIGLYMDVHVPRAVTIGLRKRGVDVLTAQEDGTALFSDPELLDRALHLQRMMFTQDVDFLTEASQRQRAGVNFATVIFAKQQVVPLGVLIADLTLLSSAGADDDLVQQVIYLPLG